MSEEQTIFRVHRNERDWFTPILNETIKDARLSFKATGILVYLLSMPGDWKASQTHLATVKTEGRDAVISGFKELIACGYVEKQVSRNERGHIVTVWNVYERSRSVAENPPRTSVADFPLPDNPLPENPTLQKNELTKEPPTPQGGKRACRPRAELDEEQSIAFGEFWQSYPRKTKKQDAERAFLTVKAFDQIEVILKALEEHKKTDQWKRGIYPHPATWLRGKQWEDDLTHETHRKHPTPGTQGRNDNANKNRTDQYAGLGRIR